MAYGNSKDLAKRTQSDKVLRDKAFKIASDPKNDGYQRGLASTVYKFFDKNLMNFFKNSSFRDNIWGIDLTDVQSLSKYYNGIKYLLCAVDIYAWVVPLKYKKGVSIVNGISKNKFIRKKAK